MNPHLRVHVQTRTQAHTHTVHKIKQQKLKKNMSADVLKKTTPVIKQGK